MRFGHICEQIFSRVNSLHSCMAVSANATPKHHIAEQCDSGQRIRIHSTCHHHHAIPQARGRHGVWLSCKDLSTPEVSPWHACVLQAWQRGDSKALFVTKT